MHPNPVFWLIIINSLLIMLIWRQVFMHHSLVCSLYILLWMKLSVVLWATCSCFVEYKTIFYISSVLSLKGVISLAKIFNLVQIYRGGWGCLLFDCISVHSYDLAPSLFVQISNSMVSRVVCTCNSGRDWLFYGILLGKVSLFDLAVSEANCYLMFGLVVVTTEVS